MTGLWNLLNSIVAADEIRDYAARNKMVLMAMLYATELGLANGFRIDEKEPEWPVAFIELPVAGQVSWHLPQFYRTWDGHSVADKVDRIAQFGEFVRSL